MATATRDQGKTTFVKEFLGSHPQGNVQAVNEAWANAGKNGTIGSTLIQKMRSQMGLTGNLRATSKPETTAKGKVATQKPETATATPGKTMFVKEFLNDHPEGNHKSVNEAWTGCRIRRHHQRSPRLPGESITGSDWQPPWEDQEIQGEVNFHMQETWKTPEGAHGCWHRATKREDQQPLACHE